MKKLMLLLLLLTSMLTASAEGIRYFTYSQVSRTVSYLNAQNELMIYCGYADEVETYVLLNEVWAEKVNSRYYEIWIFGYDAYTGEEIYMPIDLECIWLPGTNAGYYNAAQYLRFHTSIATPSLVWYIPAYNHYTRVPHVAGHARTYQWEIHRRGWQRPAWDYRNNGPAPYPPYYMRDPHTPVPQTHGQAWTPGVNRPTVPSNGYGISGQSTRSNQGNNAGIRNAEGTVSTNTSRNSSGGRGGSSSRGTSSNSGISGSSTRSTGTTSRSSNSSSTTRSSNSSSRNSSTTNSGSSSRNTGKTTNTSGTNSRGTGGTSGKTTSTGSTSRGTSNANTSGTNSRSSNANTSTSRSSNSNRGKTTNTSSTNRGSSNDNASRSTSSSTNRSSSTGASVSGSSSRGTTSKSTNSSRGNSSTTRTTNR